MQHTKKLLSLLLVLALVLSFAPMAMADEPETEQAQTVETETEVPVEETGEEAVHIETPAEEAGGEEDEPVELEPENAALLGASGDWTSYASATAPDTITLDLGSGEKTYYVIYTAAELAWFAKQCNADNAAYGSKNVLLMADIDLGGHEWTPIATYSGEFDGNGHTISNLYIQETTGEENVAFIRVLGAPGYIHDLVLSAPNVSSSGSASGNAITAALIGRGDGSSGASVRRCAVVGAIVSGTTSGKYVFVGCVIGRNNGAVLYDCFGSGDLTVTGGREVSYCGCINNESGSVENCVFVGSVGSSAYRGGFMRHNSGTVSNCWSASDYVSAEGVTYTTLRQPVYWSPGGSTKTMAEMKQDAFVDVLNNGRTGGSGVWMRDASLNSGYPTFKWAKLDAALTGGFAVGGAPTMANAQTALRTAMGNEDATITEFTQVSGSTYDITVEIGGATIYRRAVFMFETAQEQVDRLIGLFTGESVVVRYTDTELNPFDDGEVTEAVNSAMETQFAAMASSYPITISATRVSGTSNYNVTLTVDGTAESATTESPLAMTVVPDLDTVISAVSPKTVELTAMKTQSEVDTLVQGLVASSVSAINGKLSAVSVTNVILVPASDSGENTYSFGVKLGAEGTPTNEAFTVTYAAGEGGYFDSILNTFSFELPAESADQGYADVFPDYISDQWNDLVTAGTYLDGITLKNSKGAYSTGSKEGTVTILYGETEYAKTAAVSRPGSGDLTVPATVTKTVAAATTTENLIIQPTGTLALDGQTVTVNGIAYIGGTTTDSSMTNTAMGTGVLKLGPSGVLFGSVQNNGPVPLWNDTLKGWQFVNFLFTAPESQTYDGSGTATVQFIPSFGSYTKEYGGNYNTAAVSLLNQSGGAEFELYIRVEYTASGGAKRTITYTPGMTGEGSFGEKMGTLGYNSDASRTYMTFNLTGVERLKSRCEANSTITITAVADTVCGLITKELMSIPVTTA